jgi:hypothetical protein
MSKGAHAFKLTAVRRFIRANSQAAKANGIAPERLSFVLHPSGAITATVSDQGAPAAPAALPVAGELDAWMAKNAD